MSLSQTERLTLRRFAAQDGPALFDYLQTPTASCFFSMALADLDAATAEASRRAACDEHIAVCRKDSGQLVGDLFAIAEGDTFSIG